MNNSLVFGKDSSNVSRAAKCTTDGRFIMDIDKSNDVATETTLKQVKTAIENIEVNVGDITLGEISVASNDTTTHEKLDINNGLISSTNTKLDTLNTTLANKHLNKLTDSVDISGQTITVANLSTVAQQSTLSNINQHIPQMESDNDNRLKVNTEGQSINIGNNVLVNGSVSVSSGSISVSNFPSNQQVFGSVNVSNMITDYATNTTLSAVKSSIDNKHLNSGTDSVSVVGSVSVSNFPSSQTVNGTVNVSTLPAIEITNNSFEVSNFPATQPVSGTVAVSNTSFEISNLPATQPVSGTVAVSSLPAIGITNTSFEVSNFPANQVISGTVDVATLPAIGIINTSFEVSNFPATQPVSGSVNVSNFPATQPVSGSVSVSNFPTTQPVSGTVAVSNTSFEVSNFPATQPVSGTVAVSNTSFEVSNFPATQPVSGTVAVSNTSFEVSNFPATQPVSGSVSVSNMITDYALENGNLADIKTNSDKLKYVGDDLKTVISNTGFNVNNQISGYATETTLDDIRYKTNLLNFYNENGIDELMTYDRASETNLIQIKTNSDKLKYVGDDLKAVVSNTGFNVNNQITGYALENDGNLADIKTNSDKLKYVGDDLKTVISNTGFNVNNQISGYATETTLSGIKGKADNLTFDGSSNLNVNVVSGSISVESVNIKDSSGNNLNSTSNALNNYITNTSLDTHCYGSSDGTSWHHLKTNAFGVLKVHSETQDGSGVNITSTLNGSKQSLDVNVSNTVPISGSVSLTDGTDTADITPTISANLAGNKALVCDSVLYGYNSSTGHIQNITLTYDGATHNMLDVNDALGNTNLEALNDKANTLNTLTAGQTAVIGEVRDNTATTNTKLDTVNSSIGTSNSTLSTIDGKLSTTTYNSLTGLNVYQIYPQTINYLWSGQQSSGIQNVVMFGGGAALTASSFNIGSNNLKNFNIHHNGTGTKYANVDYVDSSGNLQTLTNQAITTNTSTVYISNAINVNRISWGSLSSNETSTELRVRDNVHTTSNRNIVSSFNVAQPIITVPNGYKGVIKNINIYVANGGDCHLYIRDANNNHKSTLYFANMSGAFPATPPYSGGQFPTKNYTLNLPLDALDSCYMVGLPASGGTFIFSGNVEITKI
jgi:hypothetical protein